MQEDNGEMQKEQFINFLSERLQDITGYEVRVHEVPKNNGLVLTGLTIVRENRNAYPTIYLDNYYEDYQAGRDMESIVREIKRTDEKYQVADDFDVTCFTDFNKVKANLYYKIINFEANSERLQNIPHKPILDFAKVYYVEIKNEVLGNGTILIANEHMKQWGVTAEELDTIATANTEIKLQPSVRELREILKEMKGCIEIPESIEVTGFCFNMYVVSNQKQFYGASTLIYGNLLKVIAENVKDDLIIFPSSVYEFIFVPACFVEQDYEELKEMVESINVTVLSKEEFLSNNVYFFDRHKNELMIYDGTQGW